MKKLDVHPFFNQATNTASYVLVDKASKHAAVIDPVLDLENGHLRTDSADDIVRFIDDNNLTLEWILETHLHADHLSAAQYLKSKRGGQIGISERVMRMRDSIANAFKQSEPVHIDTNQFDLLFEDNEIIYLGHLKIEAMYTPGHSSCCLSYKIEDAIFVGDALFMPDFGTARTDLPTGNVNALYDSIRRIYALPENTRVFVGHDYKTSHRNFYAWETTILEQKENNIHFRSNTSRDEFIQLKQAEKQLESIPDGYLSTITFNVTNQTLDVP